MPEATHANTWMTTAEVADLLRLEEKTLHHWASAGTGPKYKRIGGRRRYRRSDVDAWIETQPEGGGEE